MKTNYDLPALAGTSGCDPPAANSTGALGTLTAYGVPDITEGLVVLHATSLPPNQFVFMVMSASTQPATALGLGQASLCLAAPLYRWIDSVGVTF